MAKNILLLNGPNLNMLGKRDPVLYGDITLKKVEAACEELAKKHGMKLNSVQTNYEGKLVELIHEARETSDAIIINPGAYSHTSVAIFDALEMFEGPIVEVHISNIHKRENFRHYSYVSRRADSVIVGCGVQGYELALLRLVQIFIQN
ncbi:type II 3-dehydroquinate dehydratase [Paracoccaceae bacterium]|nr:type II 3-dehydroquinate dehydratase [Paracoccaceae bacterium]MDB3860132.1 type II 3-dehydroquinate dehydratase [Paracoccaceae bacterium]